MPPARKQRNSSSPNIGEYSIFLSDRDEPFTLKLSNNLMFEDFLELMRAEFPDYTFGFPAEPKVDKNDTIEQLQHRILKFTKKDGFQVFVKGLDGSTGTFYVKETTIGIELKKQIGFTWDMAHDQMRLIFAGKQIDDGQVLVECTPPVSRECTLHLVLKLRGD